MSDLKKYIARRKRTDLEFAEGFDEGCEQFKIGAVLRQAREAAGMTQEELALRLKTKKGLKFKTYRCGGKLRDFTREDAYDTRI
ncbi:MAG: hypothetical protein WCO89_11235 [Syntrophus sp. (in: bacteria)]